MVMEESWYGAEEYRDLLPISLRQGIHSTLVQGLEQWLNSKGSNYGTGPKIPSHLTLPHCDLVHMYQERRLRGLP